MKSDGALDSDPPLVLASIFEGEFKKQTELEGGLFTERVLAKRKGRVCTAADSDSDDGYQSGRKTVRKKKKSSSRRVLLAYVEAFEEELYQKNTKAARTQLEVKYLGPPAARICDDDPDRDKDDPVCEGTIEEFKFKKGQWVAVARLQSQNTGVGIESE